MNQNKKTKISPSEFYDQQISRLTDEINVTKRRRRLVSLLRLISIAVAITCFVYINKTGNIYLWIPATIALGAFLSLIKYSVNLKEAKRFKEEEVKINQNELCALVADYSVFEPGTEFTTADHPFAFDLDIFGEESIFQLLNRTSTHSGKQTLANILMYPCQDKNEISAKQKSLLELRDKVEWRQKFQATGQLEKDTEQDQKEIERWLNIDSKFNGKKVYSVLAMVLPIITVVAWGLYIASVISLGLPVLFSVLQLCITIVNLGYVNKRQSIVHKQIKTLKKFHNLIAIIEKEDFKSSRLIEIRNQTIHNGVKPSESFTKLIKLVDALDYRMNVIVGLLLNSLFLWDINYTLRIEKWSEEFKPVFPKWVDTIAQFDASSSLACFMYNNPEYVIPEISSSDKFLMVIKEGGHPLLAKEDLVTNDLYQDEHLNLFLITGANMAGKSTFLRTVGLNLVLAMSGTCVCASEFVFTPVQLYTSMRTNDSLQKQTSFFFAELKKLQFVVNELRAERSSYILLDEILKGTNSKDQHTGSARLIENIID